MENSDKLIQKRQQAEKESQGFDDIWASGFDAKGSASEIPPPFELEASALEETEGNSLHQVLPSADTRNGVVPSIPTGGGQPLPEAVRISFEESLGIGLKDVRIHNGGAAQNAAIDLKAEAFTHGLDIYFGGNGYIEGDPKSEKLLAHELLHVKQFKEGRVPSAKEQSVSSPQDSLESEAYSQEASLAKSSLEARGEDANSPELSSRSLPPTTHDGSVTHQLESKESENQTNTKKEDSKDGVGESEVNAGVEGQFEEHSDQTAPITQGQNENLKSADPQVPSVALLQADVAESTKNEASVPKEQTADALAQKAIDLGDGDSSHTFEDAASTTTAEVSAMGTNALASFHAKSKAIQVQLSTAAQVAKQQISAAYSTQKASLQAKMASQIQTIHAEKETQKSALDAFAAIEYQRFTEGKAQQLSLSKAAAEEKKVAALAFGDEQATRAKNAGETDAKQAFALAATFQITGDPEAQQAKRKALNAMAQDAALKIRRNGNDVAQKARTLALGFINGIDDAFAQFQNKLQAETGAQENIALEVASKIKSDIDKAASQAMQAVSETAAQGINALQSEEENALQAIDSRLSDLLTNAASLTQQIDESFTENLSQAIAALNDANSEGPEQETEGEEAGPEVENSSASNVADAIGQLSTAIQSWEVTTLGELDSFASYTLTQLADLATAEATRSALIGNDIAARIDEGATSALSGMQQLVGRVQVELHAATDEMLAGHTEAGNAFQTELDKQFTEGSAKLVQFVGDGIQGGSNLLSGLSGKMSGTLAEIDTEYASLKASANQQDSQISKRIMRSLWSWLDGVAESVGTWFKETLGDWLGGFLFGVLEAMVLCAVGCFLLGLAVVTLVAFGAAATMIGAFVVIIGLVVGIGFGIYNRFQEYIADNGEGPGFWEGVGLVALGILDITGIPYIVEGIVGQRAFGAKMEDFERGERIGMGVFFFATMAASVVKGIRGPQVKVGPTPKAAVTPKVTSITEPVNAGPKASRTSTTSSKSKPKFKKSSKAERKAAAEKRLASYKKYDPTKRTDAELATDLDPKQRFGESKAEAIARKNSAEAEIEVRRVIAIYEGLGDSPGSFDIVQNDLMNPDAHTVGNGTNGRHGPQIPLGRQLDANGAPNGIQTIEGRIHGDSPWPAGGENNSSRWFDTITINRTINRYLGQNWEIVRSSLAENGNHKVVVNAGEMVGDCYRNRNFGLGGARVPMGPMQTPLARLSFVLIPGPKPSFYVVTSFPEMPLNVKSPIFELK